MTDIFKVIQEDSMQNNLNFKQLANKINGADSILLTTHKQCDGDGLGAMLGLYHALKKTNKKVRVLCVDAVPKKYHFLDTHLYLETYEESHKPIEKTDLALIFDTNDERLVEPLFSKLTTQANEVLFVDHHPILKKGPSPTSGSFINTSAASTGEISFQLIQALGLSLDQDAARALYTSIAFDTQIFRYVKSSPNSHLISAELLKFDIHPEEIHRELFSSFTRGKVSFLGKVLSEIEYFANGKVALLKLSLKDLLDNGLEMDDSRDVIDMIMNVNSVYVAALFREDDKNLYKMSLRSKGNIEILDIAESYNGGGHKFAAGALINTEFESIKTQVIEKLCKKISHLQK